MLRIRICIAAPALAAVRFPTEPVILHRPFAALRTIPLILLAGLLALPVLALLAAWLPWGDSHVPTGALLREMAARHALPVLSMGMSGDFEAAIAEGATHVRVGSAIFGNR